MKTVKTSLLAGTMALASIPALAQTNTSPPTKAPDATAPRGAAPDATMPRANAPASTTVDKTANMQNADHYRASSLIGSSVMNNANESIGDINDLIVSKDGKIDRVIVGVGGFLGIGEKNVALPFNELSFTRDNNNATVVMSKVTKETLQAMPEWKSADAVPDK